MGDTAGYRARLREVRDEMEAACQRSDRSIDEIRIIGVTKTVSSREIGALLDAGVKDFGENRWQHARDMLEHARADEATWHFIGHLQSNKIKYVLPRFDFIHSIDSVDLGLRIEEFAARWTTPVKGLLQVNVSGEESKFGVPPEDVIPSLEKLGACQSLDMVGLMTMAPANASTEQVHELFGTLKTLLHRAQRETDNPDLQELSMGMSEDFGIAVEHGATMVRIGRRLMGT